MKDIFTEEKEHLSSTINKFNEVIEYTNAKLNVLPKMYKNNPFQLEKLSKQYNDKLILLTKTENKPYFARIDFKNEKDGQIEKCYISKVGVTDEDNNIVTVDWRAPISSMYYDSNIGDASYKAPEGIVKGNLLLKRQFEIENKKLLNFQDVDTVSNDEILKNYLGVSKDDRLKNIVSTIQYEQNEIIRESLYNNMIIQGVAGSGKTTVALHRVAYLVYNYIDKVNVDEYLVIGPSKFFVNYISNVLPDLDVNNVSQMTYEEIVKDITKENFTLIEEEINLKSFLKDKSSMTFEKYKLSNDYKELIDKYLCQLDKKIVPEKDFIVKGYTILNRSIINNIYNSIVSTKEINYEVFYKKIDRAVLLIAKYINDNYIKIKDKIINENLSKLSSLTKSKINEERKNLEYLKKELNNSFNKDLKKYLLSNIPKIIPLYLDFLNTLLKNDELKSQELYIEQTIKNVKSKKVSFNDLGALLYLSYRIYGEKEYKKYHHTVIDEAQDFGYLNFYALKKILPTSTFSIFGDIAQSIYEYHSTNDWELLNKELDNTDYSIKYLSKSYRTTIEIMNEANKITSYLNISTANPVIRHGNNVNYIKTKDNANEIIKIIKHTSHEKIAIITKDTTESSIIKKSLDNENIKCQNITSLHDNYIENICIIPSYLSKGLEFDVVIIYDAGSNKYDINCITDMKLLYVSFTRAMHELYVLYSNELPLPLQMD